MTNGELFIAENPNIEFKINGSCVWIYFDGVNHYTMPVKWWDKEISLFDKLRAEIQEEHNHAFTEQEDNIRYGLRQALSIIDRYMEGSE